MAAAETFALVGALISAFTLSFVLARRRVACPAWYLGACAGVALLCLLLIARYPHAWFMAHSGGGAVLFLLAGAAVIGKGAADGFNKGD